MAGDKTKIIIRHTHVAYVSTALLHKFQREFGVLNFNSWVREMAFRRYQLVLDADEGIVELFDKVRRDFYDNVGEWLQDEMRTALKEGSINDGIER